VEITMITLNADPKLIKQATEIVGGTTIILTDGEDSLYPDLSKISTEKLPHSNLILNGVCTNCACCGQDLTDAVSVQRGTGPTCSKRGYSEDPTQVDEMEAFVALSEFPELVHFLTEHYKPLGIRTLVNGLVRTASLNRPHGTGRKLGNEKVFSACCGAIEALGHVKMAGVLRDTLVVAWITKIEAEPGFFLLKTVKRVTPDWWWSEIRNCVQGSVWDAEKRVHRVSFHNATDEKILTPSNISGLTNKKVLWNLLIQGFEGAVVKVDGKIVKIAKAV
jgi:hypothetical protein